jgi:hypothetical protein
MVAAIAKLSSHQHIPIEEGYKSINNVCWKKIHACPNHCILFRGDTFKDLDKCPRCGASRYKNNDLYSRGEEEASTGKKRNKKGVKKAVQES